MALQFTENRQRNIGLSVTSNPRTVLSSVGLLEATQAEAIAGAIQVKYMSPLRVAQVIAAEATGDLTKVDDTNVTLTLGGTPTDALWNDVTITVGWTSTLAVARGGIGVGTITGLMQGNGTSAVTAITNSSTVGQVLRVTGAATYGWGAVDLADGDAITGTLPATALPGLTGDVTSAAGTNSVVVDKASEDFALTGDISPAQITATQNDYDPTGLSTATVLRLNTDASRSITGLAGGSDGRIILIHNIGSTAIILEDEDAGSTAGNRFALNADVTLSADQSAFLQYDSTSSRWRLIGGTGSAGIGGSTGATDNAALRADGTGGATLQASALVIADTTGDLSRSGGGGIDIEGTTTNDDAASGYQGEYIATSTTTANNASATVTMTIASPCVVTWTTHGFTVGGATTAIKFTTTGALPTGVVSGTTYYLKAIDANTFNIATTVANAIAGTFINTSGSQSGVHTGDIRVTLVTATRQDLAALSLGAGDWEINGQQLYATTGGESTTYCAGNVTTTTATVDRTFGRRLSFQYGGIALGATEFTVFNQGPVRFSLSATTTIFLVSDQAFTGGTGAVIGSGWLRARRMR